MGENRKYLGDSVYAHFDGYHIWLYTDNGYGPNTPSEGIALEPAALNALNALNVFLKAAAAPAACVCGHPASEHTDSMAGAPCEGAGCVCTDFSPARAAEEGR